MKKHGDIWQGDVRLVPNYDITQPPKEATLVKAVVLAEGEITGHMHTLEAEQGVLVWENMVWVVGEDPGTLQHPDHDPQPARVVPAGVAYQVVIQQERTLSGQWRQVAD